jgi:hypothetical protein
MAYFQNIDSTVVTRKLPKVLSLESIIYATPLCKYRFQTTYQKHPVLR